jgi:alkylation response protein AidB-like acyl-CoA dehydrogenase
MTIAITEDHLALHDAVRRFTADRCPPGVVRAAVDAGADVRERPPFWEELGKLGWLGLAVPEADGGEGYGVAELAVVLEELGRVVAPGPALPTAWAAAVLAAASAEPVGELAAGRLVGTLALAAEVSADVAAGAATEGATVTGAVGPVLCGAVADVLVLPCRGADGAGGEAGGAEWWGVVDLRAAAAEGTAAVAALESLDLTRPVASVELTGAAVTLLPAGVDRTIVTTLGIALAAAEAAGGAAWCVDTAATYAAHRRQFGRPIGQFQGVKHRCADMLVHLEQIRAVAWDAAAALDAARDDAARDDAARLSVAAAGAVALDAYVEVAKSCIQVLGGIGFTWEHDAHLHLRRAVSLRQLLGGGGPWRRATATAALAGTRRSLTLELPPEAEALRAEIRTTVEAIAALPKDERRGPLADAGLIVPHWARPWGRDASAVEQLVIDEELRRAKVRVPHLQVGAWAAPTIAVHGTPEQQERWVRPTLHGQIAWCQLFSEPEAGSDLAALTTAATRAERNGVRGWSLQGQKVWTSMAKEADWGICLARTNPSAPKHLGITYFLVDMRSPGIDIRPLRELTGMEMFNEVFLDDVFVPDDCVVGEVDGGWPLARTTLANERVSMGSGSSFGGGVENLVGLVAERIASGQLDGDDPLLLDTVGGLVAEAHSVAVLGLRTAVRSVTGAAPGSEASVRKLLGVEHDQRTQEIGLSLLGPEGATAVGAAASWTFGFLANRCLTIAGGTSEIQRNVIGERLLGLPRD